MQRTFVFGSLVAHRIAAGLACGIIASCGATPPPKEPSVSETVTDGGTTASAAPRSLYERLGKRDGIALVYDTFLQNLQADARFSKRMAALKGPRLDKLKKDFLDLMCVESGGATAGADCRYEGRLMKELLGAKGKLKEEEWVSMLSALRAALEEHSVGDDDLQEVAVIFGKFHEDAVDPKSIKH